MKLFSRLDLQKEIRKRYQKSNGVIDVSDIDISNVRNMSGVFKDLENVRQIIGLDTWDVSRVEDMSEMFSGCKSLKKSPTIANWNVGKVETMQNMFYDCQSLESISLAINYISPVDGKNHCGAWYTENLKYVKSMFENCHNLQKIDGLDGLEVSNVEDMSRMFANCINLKSCIPTDWNMSQVTNISDMFSLKELAEESILDAKEMQLKHYSELYNNPTLSKNVIISNDDIDLYYNDYLKLVKQELEQEETVVWEMEIGDAIDLGTTYDEIMDEINNSNTVNELVKIKESITSMNEWLPASAFAYGEEAFEHCDLDNIVSERVQDAITIVDLEEQIPMTNDTRDYLVNLLEQYETNHYAYDIKITDSNNYCEGMQKALDAALDFKLKHLMKMEKELSMDLEEDLELNQDQVLVIRKKKKKLDM